MAVIAGAESTPKKTKIILNKTVFRIYKSIFDCDEFECHTITTYHSMGEGAGGDTLPVGIFSSSLAQRFIVGKKWIRITLNGRDKQPNATIGKR